MEHLKTSLWCGLSCSHSTEVCLCSCFCRLSS